MPLLTYTAGSYPFQPFTKILSADVNSNFNVIQTLLNTTKLDDTNVQVNGLTRNGATSRLKAGTANYVVINGSDGNMSEEATLSPARGGLGITIGLPDATKAGYIPQVNAGGTAFTLVPVPVTSASSLYSFYNLT